MHCKDTILRTQNNWPYSKLIPNSGNYLPETTINFHWYRIQVRLELVFLYNKKEVQKSPLRIFVLLCMWKLIVS